MQQEHPTSRYPDVLAETMRRVGAALGAPVSDDEAAAFGASVGEWPAFPDSSDALHRLHTRYRLIILSNVDRASFARSAARLGVDFDLVITAEDVGAYKPSPLSFAALLAGVDDLGIPRERLLHVAESLYHDHVPAQANGLRSVWIDRPAGGRQHRVTPARPARAPGLDLHEHGRLRRGRGPRRRSGLATSEPAGRLAGVEEPDGDQKRSVKEKGTEAVAKARARAEELLSQAEANRPRSRLIDIAFGSYERDAEVGGGILAGAVAFRVFLFIVPFVFFFVVAFGLAVDATGTSVTSAADKAGIAGLLATTIKNVGDQSVWSRLTILGISGFALVLGARNLVKVLTVIHVLIWRLPRVRVRRQARAVGLLILSVLGALVLAQLVSKLQDRSFPAWVFATSLFMLIPAGLWLVASLRLFPHPPEVGWRDLVPGALLVGVGIEALHIFTVVYIAHSFERKSETYGAIGGSLSLLLWAYVAGRILAASPVINAVVWRRTHAHDLPPPVVPNLPPPVVSNLPPPAEPGLPRPRPVLPSAAAPGATGARAGRGRARPAATGGRRACARRAGSAAAGAAERDSQRRAPAARRTRQRRAAPAHGGGQRPPARRPRNRRDPPAPPCRPRSRRPSLGHPSPRPVTRHPLPVPVPPG